MRPLPVFVMLVVASCPIGAHTGADPAITTQRTANSEPVGLIEFELRLAEPKPSPGLTAVKRGDSPDTIYVSATPVVTNEDIVGARVVDVDGRFAIGLEFTSKAAERLRAATASHVGKPIAIMINGRVASAPVLTAPISDSAMISGSFTRKEAEELVSRFSAIATKNRAKAGMLCRMFGWC